MKVRLVRRNDSWSSPLLGSCPHLVCVGTPQYFNIIPQLPSMTSVWDEKTWTQYAYFSGGGFVSFDDEAAICAKTEYCLDHELGESGQYTSSSS